MRHRLLYSPLTLFLITLLSYAYVLNGDFFGDDTTQILHNPDLQSYLKALTGNIGDRPFLMIVVTTIAKVFGKETLWFRIFSVLIHALASFQLFQLILEYNRKFVEIVDKKVAFGVACLFALHPLHNQSITTGIQISIPFAGLFGIVSLRYFLKLWDHFEIKNYVISVLALLTAILFKPIISFVPMVYFLARNRLSIPKQKRIAVVFSYFAILLLPALFYFGFDKNVQSEGLDTWRYFAVQTEVWFTYFRLMIAPTNLHFLYDFAAPESLLSFSAWKYLLLHVFLILLAFRLLKNKSLFNILVCFYLSFLPESSFFAIFHIAFEHRTYFPMVFLFLFIGTFLIQNPKIIEKKTIYFTVFSCIALLYLILNQVRNAEIKTYRSWVINTLENSHSHHRNNFKYNFNLSNEGDTEIVDSFVAKYKALYPNSHYDVLENINSFFKIQNRLERKKFLPEFENYLKDSNLPFEARFFIIRLILDNFSSKESPIEDIIAAEKIISTQLKVMTRTTPYFHFVDRYFKNSNFLFSPENKEKTKTLDMEYYFIGLSDRIVYLKEKDPQFLNELFLRKKGSPVLEALYEDLLKNPEFPKQ